MDGDFYRYQWRARSTGDAVALCGGIVPGQTKSGLVSQPDSNNP